MYELDSGYEPWARANVKRDMPIGADAARELLAKLDAARADLERLRAIEDRANRAIAHLPADSEWVMAARLILDGHCGRREPLDK